SWLGAGEFGSQLGPKREVVLVLVRGQPVQLARTSGNTVSAASILSRPAGGRKRPGAGVHGGKANAAGRPRKSWLRKSRAERPCCQHVRHTDIRTDWVRAPGQVRLPPQTLRRMTPKRMASSARQLVASRPGTRRKVKSWSRWFHRCRARRSLAE